MKKSEKDLERLEYLLQHQTYASLSAEDQQLVLTLLESEEEYERMRQLTIALPKALSAPPDLTPLPIIQASIHHRLAHEKDKLASENGQRWWQYRIPAYQVAAGVGLLVGLFWLLNSPTTHPSVAVRPLAAAPVRIDTVYLPSQPDTLLVEKTVLVQKPANQPIHETPIDVSASFIPPAEEQFSEDSLGLFLEAKGTTMREDSTLSELLVTDF